MLARLRKSAENKDSGFTLIELLVVMIIIGILAAIAIPAFLNQKKKAKETAAKSDATNISKEVAAALVDGDLNAVSITGSGVNWTLSMTTALGTETAAVKVSAGNVPTVTTTGTATVPTGVYCVTVTPSDTAIPAWSAGNNGLFKNSVCA